MAWNPRQALQDGKYILESKLGQGRFAITYLAKDRNGKELVIKTLDEDKLNQLTSGERNSLTNKFVNEGRKLERCKHAHVVSLLDTFMEGQLFCLAMEYIHGNTLESIVGIRKFLPEQEALGYIRQIGEALIEVHEQGLLHRDVKPENIIVRAGQHNVVLIDFDLADEFDHPLTSRFKDKRFAPIELNSSTRPRGSYTDVYSLAATLYFLLTGDLPASAMDRKDGTASLIPPKIINPLISEPVNHAILKGMELQPDARPQTMKEWLNLLGLTSNPELSSPPRKKAWNWATIWGAVGAIATVVGVIWGFIVYWKPPSSPSPEPTSSATPKLQVTPTQTNN
ncbi:MAG TPA: serine/threonine-protein kinase [Coleofasciculaceae cyanobacterium]|jgi:serine/threonine-protein kinase